MFKGRIGRPPFVGYIGTVDSGYYNVIARFCT